MLFTRRGPGGAARLIIAADIAGWLVVAEPTPFFLRLC
jgi:hypothetical protein